MTCWTWTWTPCGRHLCFPHLLFILLVFLGSSFSYSPHSHSSHASSSSSSSFLLLPSEKFQICRFNVMCYCKYSTRTELYDALSSLWHHSSFNETIFLKSVHKEFLPLFAEEEEARGGVGDSSDPEEILGHLVEIVVNKTKTSTMGGHMFDPGPVYEFFCVNVPMAMIPTDYNAPGVLSHVSVVGSRLNLLDGSAFAGLEVTNVQLNKNELYFISEYAFSSMSNSLTVLDLSGNFLDEIPLTALKSLKLLEWLNLSNNKIHSLEGDWFSLPSSLRQLTLSSNSIGPSLPSKLFPAFSRLIWLDLSSNFIRNLSQHNLPPNLQTLIMTKNPMSFLPLGIFSLRSLSWIVFSGCGIQTIPTDWPRGIAPTQINQMDLTGNYIQHWPSSPFSKSLKIWDLDLSKNYLESLPSGAFESMNAFRLSLGHNRIQSIDPQAFSTLGSTLQYLNLDNNRLSSVPWEALLNLTSLRHLYLGNNAIGDENLGGGGEEEGENESFLDSWGCSLSYLGLNGNGVTNLPTKILSRCSNSLIHLNLGYNRIQNLDEFGSPDGKKWMNLSTLVLRNNPIHSLEEPEPERKQKPLISSSSSSSAAAVTILNPEEIRRTKEKSSRMIFKPEKFPRLFELSLSFCELSGELMPFPPLPLTNLEISNGLKSATHIGSDVFHKLQYLEWVALDHNQINSVSEYAFYANKNLSYVNLDFNRISTLPRQLFHPDIHTSIREVRLSHNKIGGLHSETFVSFPGVSLDLSYNQIHTVEQHAFTIGKVKGSTPSPSSAGASTPDGLRLYLNHNRLALVKNGAFSSEKFAVVDLSYNSLTSFTFSAFGRRTFLGGLNISHNQIEKTGRSHGRKMLIRFLDASYNKLDYEGVKSLVENVCPSELLDLSHNKVEKVDGEMWPKNCSKIKELNLNFNQIGTVDPSAFSELKDLTALHLRGNQLSYVVEILFIRNHKLTFLDMGENRIRSLPRDSLVGSGIEILSLAGNEFVNLPVGALSQISRRLKSLDISKNSIEHLDSTMFESVPGLVSLNLSLNRLSILPDNAFANLGSLRELDLSNNVLRANFKELFHFLPKLKVLRLSSCGIRVLPHLPLPHLISLDLSSNGMVEMSSQSLTSLGRLRELDVSSNELTTGRIPNWAPLKNLVTLKLSRNPVKSLTRDTFWGLHRLQSLELVGLNNVGRFDSDVLSYLMNLKKLKVETYPNIEKYRFRLGAILSGIESLEELEVHVKEEHLSDQLRGGILPGLRKLVIRGTGNLTRIEDGAFEGLQNCLHMELRITETSVEEVPGRIFELLLQAEWAKVDLSWNKMSSLSSTSLYPNSSFWFAKGTKLLQGGLILSGNEWICDCNLVWLGDWYRRWLRESFESHSTSVGEVHSMYQLLGEPTCLDSSRGRRISLIELYPDHICHASALSRAPHPLQGESTPLLLILVILWSLSISLVSSR